MVCTMRRLFPALSVLVACGGGAGDAGKAKTAGAGDDSDKDFAQYAATHGLRCSRAAARRRR